MRLLAIADLHGRADRLERLRSAVLRLRPDAVVAAGDLTGLRRPDLTVRQLCLLGKPVFAVRGNSDRKSVDRLLADNKETTPLHLQRIVLGDVPFVGVGGAVPVPPFGTRAGWREKSVLAEAAGLIDDNTVVVSHTPPHGVLDRVFFGLRGGSRGLLRLIEERRPRMLICGHIHEQPGSDYVGPTLVVNCSLANSGGVLIEIDGPRGLRVDVLTK